MNDMKETVAEIRRRGEARIRARKRMQTRVFAFCVPLVLCLAAWLAFPVLESTTYSAIPEETAIPATLQENTENTVDHMQDVTFTALLTVTGQGIDRTYTDQETVSRASDLIQSLLDSWQYASDYSSNESRGGTPAVLAQENKNGIRLVFSKEEETLEYVLNSRSLFDVQENLGYMITDTQYQAIVNILGID